ncbi:MBL fold metallo-hydrolase [Pseudoalteromonas sp. SSM20]|uniref:MBL fold metallo-hydrolase n=1 Tax=Pseudoalteromonas sp. SSM20 TaxID=3139394 RepID=UPI003BAAC7BE
MILSFYGTRGSIPTPGPKTVKYGGNTACAVISQGDEFVILDSGTGIRVFGDELIKDKRPINILLTHHHWDHIQGFPFFAPIYQTGREINIYVPETSPRHDNAILSQMDESYFPVNYRQLPSNITLKNISQANFNVAGFSIKCFPINHPNNGLAYIVSRDQKQIAYVTDNELFPEIHQTTDYEQLLTVLDDIDVLIHDGQYLDFELYEKHDWGHSSVEQAVLLAEQCKAKKTFIYSHAPERTDDEIDACYERLSKLMPTTNLDFAKEGLQFDLSLLREL